MVSFSSEGVKRVMDCVNEFKVVKPSKSGYHAIYLSVQESCLSVGIHPLVLEVSPSDKEAAELDRLRLDYHFTPVFEDDIPKVTFNGVDYTPGKVGKKYVLQAVDPKCENRTPTDEELPEVEAALRVSIPESDRERVKAFERAQKFKLKFRDYPFYQAFKAERQDVITDMTAWRAFFTEYRNSVKVTRDGSVIRKVMEVLPERIARTRITPADIAGAMRYLREYDGLDDILEFNSVIEELTTVIPSLEKPTWTMLELEQRRKNKIDLLMRLVELKEELSHSLAHWIAYKHVEEIQGYLPKSEREKLNDLRLVLSRASLDKTMADIFAYTSAKIADVMNECTRNRDIADGIPWSVASPVQHAQLNSVNAISGNATDQTSKDFSSKIGRAPWKKRMRRRHILGTFSKDDEKSALKNGFFKPGGLLDVNSRGYKDAAAALRRNE